MVRKGMVEVLPAECPAVYSAVPDTERAKESFCTPDLPSLTREAEFVDIGPALGLDNDLETVLVRLTLADGHFPIGVSSFGCTDYLHLQSSRPSQRGSLHQYRCSFCKSMGRISSGTLHHTRHMKHIETSVFSTR